MKDETIKHLYFLLNNEKSLEAKELFNSIPDDDTLDYHLLKGKIAQKFQQWSEALNAYHRVLDLDPSNVEAENNIHLIQNILNFWNPDMFNP